MTKISLPNACNLSIIAASSDHVIYTSSVSMIEILVASRWLLVYNGGKVMVLCTINYTSD